MLSEENDVFKTKISNPLRCLKITDMWKTQNLRVSAILMWCPSIIALNFVEGMRGFLALEFKVSLLFEKVTVKLCIILQWLTYMLLGYLQTYRSWLCKRTGSSKYGYNICGNPEVSGAYVYLLILIMQ